MNSGSFEMQKKVEANQTASYDRLSMDNGLKRPFDSPPPAGSPWLKKLAAMHNSEIWGTGHSGTRDEIWKNDATAWSFEE